MRSRKYLYSITWCVPMPTLLELAACLDQVEGAYPTVLCSIRVIVGRPFVLCPYLASSFRASAAGSIDCLGTYDRALYDQAARYKPEHSKLKLKKMSDTQCGGLTTSPFHHGLEAHGDGPPSKIVCSISVKEKCD